MFYFGGSSLGFILGSSLPFPAGRSPTSFSSTISSVISTLPWNVFLEESHTFTTTSKSQLGLVKRTNTYSESGLPILLHLTGPPALHRPLGEKWVGKWFLGRGRAHCSGQHFQAALFRTFCGRDQVEKIQLKWTCDSDMNWQLVIRIWTRSLFV